MNSQTIINDGAQSHSVGVLLQKSIAFGLLLTMLVYAAALGLTIRTAGQPYFGAFVEPTLLVTQDNIHGLQAFDQLTTIDGRPLLHTWSFSDILGELEPGRQVRVDALDSAGATCTISVKLERWPISILIEYFFVPAALGLAFLALGFWVFRARQDQSAGRAFTLFCIAVSLNVGALFDLMTTHRLVFFWLGGMAFLGGTLVHMALVFPKQSSLDQRWPWLRRIVYLPSIVWTLWLWYISTNLSQPRAYIDAWRITYGYIALALAFLLAMLLRRRFSSPSPLVRQQANVMLWGLGVATLPVFVWFVLAFFRVSFDFEPALFLPPLVFFPISTAYAIQRHRLMEIDSIINQSLSYALLTAIVVGGYFVIINATGALLGQAVEADHPIVVALFVLCVALLLAPLRERLQTVVDRLFYRDRLDYRQEQDAYAHALSELLNQAEVLQSLTDRIRTVLHPASMLIYLYNEREEFYRPVFIEPEPRSGQFDDQKPMRLLPDGGLAQRLVEQHKSIYLTIDASLPPRLQAEIAQLKALGANLYIPIAKHGWIALGSKRSGALYGKDDLAYLEALGNQTAIALDRVKLIDDLESRLNELDALRWISQAFSFTVELDDLLELVYAQTSRILDTTNFYIALHDEEKGTISFAFFVENGERLYPDDEWLLGIGLTSEIVCTGNAIITDDYASECIHRDIPPGGRAGRAWMGVPLRSADRVVGVMNVSSFEPNIVYTPEQQKIFAAIADQAAAIIDRARLYREMEESTRQLATLNEVGRAITSLLDLETVLEMIMSKAVEILNSEAGSLILTDLETDELVFKVAIGPTSADLVGVRLPPGTGIVGQVVDNAQSVIVQDAQSDVRWNSDLDESTSFVTRAILAVPLISKEKCIGVIELINKLDGTTFDQEDEGLLLAFATNAAVAIENARLFTQTDQALAARVQELSAMQRIDRELNATLDYQRVLAITLDWALRITGAQAGAVGQLDEESGNLILAATQGYPEDFVCTPDSPWLIDRGIIGRVVRMGQPALINDVSQDLDYIATNPKTRAQLAVPIERGGQPIGVLSVESQVDAFGQEHLDFMTRLADHAAAAIENARLYEQVKKADDAKSQFVSIVAHEMKIPMTSIKGYARLLELGAAGVLDETQTSFIHTITSNVDRMARLVSDLLDISRVETGRISLNVEKIALVSVIDDALRSTKNQIKERGLELLINVPQDLPLVDADHTRLVQILTNLISNAYKYTTQGSITIKAQKVNAAINDGDEPIECVKCSVIDTGIGIALEDQERLFQSQFVRFANAVDVAHGHGLGLWLTNRLVQLQDGELFFESELDKGSIFGFILPAANVQH